MATAGVRIPPLTSASDPPPLFDGTTRLYISYTCPYAQRVWIARNYKGLQEKIELVPIDLQNRPTWYKEKVYPENKVPSLEHNGKILGESLDLLKYVEANFEGPSLFPTVKKLQILVLSITIIIYIRGNYTRGYFGKVMFGVLFLPPYQDPAKREFGDQLISHVDSFTKDIYSSFKGDTVQQASASFDYLESVLGRFDDGLFFLGQFSWVDVAYGPFVERFNIIFSEVYENDIKNGRPKLAAYIEELSKIDAYEPTKVDPKEFVEVFKKTVSGSAMSI